MMGKFFVMSHVRSVTVIQVVSKLMQGCTDVVCILFQ